MLAPCKTCGHDVFEHVGLVAYNCAVGTCDCDGYERAPVTADAGGMSRADLLLTQLAEEAAEIAQRVCKALRFGLDDMHTKDGETLSNAEWIAREIYDLIAVVGTLADAGAVPIDETDGAQRIAAERERIEKWLQHSDTNGRIH